MAAAVSAALAQAAPGADTTGSAVGGGTSPEDVRHVPRKLELTPREKLTYDLKWSGFPAGRATLEVKWKRDFEGAPAYHVECEVRSNAFVSSVARYPVRNKSISIIDVDGAFSRLFRMSKREDKIRQDEYIRFDYEKGLAEYEKRLPGPFPTREIKRVRIHDKMQDPLSCIYYLRTAKLSPGMTVSMPVQTARRTWALVVEVLRREEIELPGLGTVSALRLEPGVRFPGLFVRKGRMVIWVDEETGIPVRMNVDVPVGSISVTLVAVENAPMSVAGSTSGESSEPGEAGESTEPSDEKPVPPAEDGEAGVEGEAPEAGAAADEPPP